MEGRWVYFSWLRSREGHSVIPEWWLIIPGGWGAIFLDRESYHECIIEEIFEPICK
jgi:hypothetical protein